MACSVNRCQLYNMSYNQQNNHYCRDIKVWPSLVRIAAMLWIFIYHYLVMLDIEHYPFFRSIYAVMVFCFLSGYFSITIKSAPHKWILKRYFRIMIPYWIVMVTMIMANCYVQYKQTTILDTLIILSGGSLFLSDPLYIISWFITLILLLYATVYLYTVIPSPFKFVFLALAFYLFSLKAYASCYFISFFLGLFFRKNLDKNNRISASKSTFSRKVATSFFKIQGYSYCFFLVHGAVLHLFVKMMMGQPVKIFLLSFVLSGVSSVFLYEADKMIRGRISFMHHRWLST